MLGRKVKNKRRIGLERGTDPLTQVLLPLGMEVQNSAVFSGSE